MGYRSKETKRGKVAGQGQGSKALDLKADRKSVWHYITKVARQLQHFSSTWLNRDEKTKGCSSQGKRLSRFELSVLLKGQRGRPIFPQ